MILKQTTAPTSDAVSFDDLRDHARVTSHDEDALLSLYLKASIRYVENATRRQLITATWRLTQDVLSGLFVVVPRPPLQTVTHVKYYDTAGDQQTMSSGEYDVDTDSDPGRIVLGYSETWPAAQRGHINDIEIVYVAGYGTAAADVPETIRDAILLLATHWYEMRQPVVVGMIVANIPLTVDHLLWSERCNGFG